MKAAVGAIFITSFLLYVAAAPSPPRLASTRSRLTARDRQLLGYLLCVLQGDKGCALDDDDDNAVDAPPPSRRGSHARLQTLEEEEVVPPEGLSSFHAMPDRRDAFYSDWRRRK